MAHQLVQPGRQRSIAETVAEPVIEDADPQRRHRLHRIGGQQLRGLPGAPDFDPTELQWTLGTPGGTGGDTAGTGSRRIAQEGGRGPVLGILGQHAAHKVGDQRRQSLLRGQGGVAADVQLAAQDRRIVQPGQRLPAQRQGQQQDAEGIDIIPRNALATAGGQAHGTVGRLVEGGLQGGGRGGPGSAQHRRLARAGVKHIVRPDRTVGDADAVQCLQRLRDGPQHQVQQLRLPPRAWIGGDGRAGRRGADHEIAGSALPGGADTVGDRAQNSIHLGRQYLQGEQPGR